ncbi:hypothetical protein pEaSNUABM37_00148 [Erwinia phage pEa_SNUABM_37]|nr:hypothetical protein pEaSNUABM37_00148 [Erwinia phage pEa_SNUABM_37]QXO10618.1 hypothetical protein pEaSNUABM48_00148 [Erwinia phage pEa_SNUABM_48]
MATNIVPPMSLRGLWTLGDPFKLTANTIYTVEAVRTFSDILNQKEKVDPVELIYTPVGLDKTAYDADVQALAKVISLTAPGQPTVYVPSTYIVKMPDDTAVSYDYVVISASLGAVPTTLVSGIQQLLDTIQDDCSDLIGVRPTVNVSVAPSSGSVTVQQHRLNEENRLAAIKNRITEHAQNIALTAENERLRLIIKDYEKRLTGQS